MIKSEKKGIRSLINKNIILTVILCAEILCLGVLLFKAIRMPATDFSHAVSDFAYEEASNIKPDGETLIFSPAEGISKEERQTISGEKFSLPSGAYDFTISYESDTDGTGNYTNSSGTVTVSSEHHEIETETLTFDDGHNVVSGRLWIPIFSHCDDLKVTISYNGEGTLRIKDCRMTEYTLYRVVRFLGVLIFFLVIDGLYILFFTLKP